MTCINWVSIWRKCFNYSVGLKYLRPGGRVSVAKEFIVILKECFVLGAIMLVLHVSLRLAPGAKGLVKADGPFKEARSMNAQECFPYAPAEYFPVFCRWFWKAWPNKSQRGVPFTIHSIAGDVFVSSVGEISDCDISYVHTVVVCLI